MLDQYQITILLNRFGKDWNEQMQKTIAELNKTGLFNTISHTQNTNAVIASLKSPSELLNAVAKINKIPNVSFVTIPPYLKEVSVAIENHEFFKAFTLCCSLYESFGTNILIKHFKGRLSLNSKKLEKLGVHAIIIMPYTHGFITEGIYSEMLSVNSVRNDLVHRYLVSLESEDIQNEIKENTPKISKTLSILNEINERVSNH